MTGLTDVGGRRAGTAAVPDGAAPPTRTIRRRGSLPGGRAVVGAFLVTVAAVGLFAAFATANAGPRTRYVVAARDVAVGSQLAREDLAVVALDLPPAQRSGAFTDVEVLVGATVLGPLRQHDLVQSSGVVAVDPARGEQVSFPIPAERALSGRILPGERIDVLVTYGSGTDAYTMAVVRDAEVLDVEDEPGGIADGGTRVLTIGVPPTGDSLRVVHAVTAGEVTVVRTTGLDRGAGLPEEYRPPGVAPAAPAGGGGG